MIKTINAKKFSSKKNIKILLFLPLILIGLFALFIAGIYVTDPIFDRLDHDKFANLDTQMQVIFKELKTVPNGTDEWIYSTSCDTELSGDFPTGKYYCTALISMEKAVSSVKEVNDLQAKYYPIVDGSSALKQKTELDPEYPNDFSKKFVVSGAEKHYIELKSGILCGYSIQLRQSVENITINSDLYGSEINNRAGRVDVRLDCNEIARDYWYTISNPALLPEPNAPLIKE